MVKILAALIAALSILNSSGASPGATEKVAALGARATCSGASHSSAYGLPSPAFAAHGSVENYLTNLTLHQ